MKLQITPTIDEVTQAQFTTFINQKTGMPADLSVEEAIYWGNRAIQIAEHFCNCDHDVVAVRVSSDNLWGKQ